MSDDKKEKSSWQRPEDVEFAEQVAELVADKIAEHSRPLIKKISRFVVLNRGFIWERVAKKPRNGR